MEEDKEKERLERKKTYNELFNAATVGMALVSGVIVGGAIGYFLDKWLGTSPWLLFYYIKKAGIELESLKDDKNKK